MPRVGGQERPFTRQTVSENPYAIALPFGDRAIAYELCDAATLDLQAILGLESLLRSHAMQSIDQKFAVSAKVSQYYLPRNIHMR